MYEALPAIIAAQIETHYRYRNAVDEPWTYPSQAFEQQAGVTGVSREYAMPEGRDPKAVYIDIARSEAEYELLSSYRKLAEQMGGLSPENWEAHAAKLQEAQTIFRSEIEALKRHGSLAEVEEKAYEGYALQAQGDTLAGLAELMGAGCTEAALHSLHAQAYDAMEQRLDATYDALEALNPELSVLTSQIENQSQKRYVVLGALSKYNVADIKGFSIDGITYREAQQDPVWMRQWQEIEQRSGGKLDGWIPAKSTQMLILRQLRQRDEPAVSLAG